jgi:hypothetical protein
MLKRCLSAVADIGSGWLSRQQSGGLLRVRVTEYPAICGVLCGSIAIGFIPSERCLYNTTFGPFPSIRVSSTLLAVQRAWCHRRVKLVRPKCKVCSPRVIASLRSQERVPYLQLCRPLGAVNGAPSSVGSIAIRSRTDVGESRVEDVQLTRLAQYCPSEKVPRQALHCLLSNEKI